MCLLFLILGGQTIFMKMNSLFDTPLLGVAKDFDSDLKNTYSHGFVYDKNNPEILWSKQSAQGTCEYPKGMILRILHKFLIAESLTDSSEKDWDFGGIYESNDSLILSYCMLDLSEIKRIIGEDGSFSDKERVILKIDNTGKVSGCYAAESGEKTEYKLQMTGQKGISTEGYIAAVAAWLIYKNHDDLMENERQFLNQHFGSIMSNVMNPSCTDKKSEMMILAYNIYTLMEYQADVLKKYGVAIPFQFSPAGDNMVEFQDLIESPEPLGAEIIGKKTTELKSRIPSSGTRKTNQKKNMWDDLYGKYEVSDRKLTPYEESLIFHIPDYYQEPKNLLKYAEMYKQTFGKRMNIRFLLLCGPSGSGKTEWANMFSHLIRRPKVTFNCDAEMTKDDLLTRFVPANGKAGTIVHVPTQLLEALEFGWIVEIAEPTLLNPAVMAAMNSLFDGIGKTATPDGRIIQIHPETVVIMTTNLKYEGCNSMNQSVISRFVPVNIPYLEKNQLVERMQIYSGFANTSVLKKMADVYYSAIKQAEDLEIWDGAIDVRGMCQWATATAVNGKVWENGLDIFISKCSLGDNLDVFIHCLEKSFSKGEVVKV